MGTPADKTQSPSAVSRRGLLAGAGVAAGFVVIGLPDGAGADTRDVEVGSGPTDRRSVSFVGRVDQNGPTLTAYGYFVRINGVPVAKLFTSPPAITSNDPRSGDPSPSRFTFVVEAQITGMSRVGDVITGVADGTARFFHLPNGGANFDAPASFAAGVEIADFTGTFQNDLLIDGESRGAVSMTADFTQRTAPLFALDGQRTRFGRLGLPWNMRASGRAVRTEPTTPRAVLSISGDLAVVDAHGP